MAKKGVTDRDKGFKKIVKSMKDLGLKGVNAGIPEGAPSDKGVSVAQYGYWNETGVKAKGSGWKIPPRPFMRGWVDSHKEEIKSFMQSLAQRIADGKTDSDTALKLLGNYAESGIREHIKSGSFTPNAPITIQGGWMRDKDSGKAFKVKGKGSSQPLIDEGTLRDSIRYEIVKKKKNKKG